MSNPVRFDHVVIFKPIFFVFIGVLVMAPSVYFIRVVLPIAGAVVWGAFMGLVLILFVFRSLSKTVVISFDTDQVQFKVNRTIICYTKAEVTGFYSFDYTKSSVYRTSISIHFMDGKKLDISDYKRKPASLDPKRKQQLHKFIVEMEHELGFKPLRENKVRKFLRLGYIWYARLSI